MEGTEIKTGDCGNLIASYVNFFICSLIKYRFDKINVRNGLLLLQHSELKYEHMITSSSNLLYVQ